MAEMMAKGAFASINLATKDLGRHVRAVQAGDAEVVQEPPSSRTRSATAPSVIRPAT